jgi:hypothetical protein
MISYSFALALLASNTLVLIIHILARMGRDGASTVPAVMVLWHFVVFVWALISLGMVLA